MKRYRVEVSPEAQKHIEAVHEWWAANRPFAPSLFTDELTAALTRLEQTPSSGTPYPDSPEPGMRRLSLPRTRYHAYYTVVQSTVRIHAVWHARREQGPPLP